MDDALNRFCILCSRAAACQISRQEDPHVKIGALREPRFVRILTGVTLRNALITRSDAGTSLFQNLIFQSSQKRERIRDPQICGEHQNLKPWFPTKLYKDYFEKISSRCERLNMYSTAVCQIGKVGSRTLRLRPKLPKP